MSDAITALTVPKLGLTMKVGTVSGWHVEVGAPVVAGQPVFDVETEKVTSECAADRDAILRRQVAAKGATLPVGALVGVLAKSDVLESDIDRFIADFKPQSQA